MKQIILGREGNQKFKITASHVSKEHALITIDDQNNWTLKDLHSKNGTYIQKENGEYIRIHEYQIDEYTRIALGGLTAMGYTFIAHHILEEDPADYKTEFRHILDLNEQLQEERERYCKNNIQETLRWIILLTPGIIGLSAFLYFPHERIWIATLTSIIISLLNGLMKRVGTDNKKKKRCEEKINRLIACPCCNSPLSKIELEKECCAHCKAHA